MATTLTTSYQKIGEVSSSTYTKLRLYAKYDSRNITNVNTTVTLQTRMYCSGNSSSFASGTISYSMPTYNSSSGSWVNTTKSANLSNVSVSGGSEVVLNTWTVTVNHDASGNYSNKTVSATLSTSYTQNGTVSASINLPSIVVEPDYANFLTHGDSTIASDSVTIEWSADANCGSVEYSLNNRDWITVSTSTSSSGSYTISSLLSGTRYSVRTRIKHATSGMYTVSDRLYIITSNKGYILKLNVNGEWVDAIPYLNINELVYANGDEVSY